MESVPSHECHAGRPLSFPGIPIPSRKVTFPLPPVEQTLMDSQNRINSIKTQTNLTVRKHEVQHIYTPLPFLHHHGPRHHIFLELSYR